MTNLLKQTTEKPLFPELIWSKPENRRHAGKLGIIGGNSFGFASVGQAYHAAMKAGAGTIRVLLPDAVQKVVGPVIAEGEFAPSNPSGSFSQQALSSFLDIAQWSDAALLAGDLGRNSETAIILEKFVQKFDGSLTITKDALDYFTGQNIQANLLAKRPYTTLVSSLAQLQKLATSLKFQTAITFNMDVLRLSDALADLTKNYPFEIVVRHLDQIFVAVSGKVSVTPANGNEKIWRVSTAAAACVWRMHNPQQPFESLTTSLIESQK